MIYVSADELILYASQYINKLYAPPNIPSMKQTARTIGQLGAIIRRERKKQGLTQASLGEKVGLRQATISKLEAGEPGTQIRTVLDTIAALGLEIVIDERRQGAADDIENVF